MTRPLTCPKCDQEARALQQKQQKAFELQQKRNTEQREHARAIAKLEEQIELKVQARRDDQISKERADAIRQKTADLAVIKAQASRPVSSSSCLNANPQVLKQPLSHESKSLNKKSVTPSSHSRPAEQQSTLLCSKLSSEVKWQRQKDVENASNIAIDSMMEMIGLEDVKSQVLRIKAKVDATIRQTSGLKNERFNVSLLGNPGTGLSSIIETSPP